jgi:hypothetical protein
MLKGSLKKINLNEVLSRIAADSKTGILEISSGKKRLLILFDEGAVVYAISLPLKNIIDDLTRWEPSVMSHIQTADKKVFTDINLLIDYLRSNNIMSVDSLKNFLYINTKNVIFDSFLLRKGTFKFNEKEVNYNKELFSLINTDYINMEASRIIDELNHVSGFYPGDDTIISKSDEISSKFIEELTDAEKMILSKIEENTTPSELSFITKMPLLESKIAISWLNQKHLIKCLPKSRLELAKIKILKKWLINAVSSFFFIFLIFLSFILSPLNPLKYKEVKGTVTFYKLYSSIGVLQQRKIASAIELYKWEKGVYPQDINALVKEKFLLKQDLTFPWGKEYYYSMKDNTYVLLQPGR